MKFRARRVRSASGEETEIILGKDGDNRRRIYTLERDQDGRRHLSGEFDSNFANPADERGPRRSRGRRYAFDEHNFPRGAPIGPPNAKFVVHDIRPLSPPQPRGTYLVVVTRAADGARGAFRLHSSAGGCSAADEDEERFDALFATAARVPGKIAGLIGDIEAGARVAFPVELDNA